MQLVAGDDPAGDRPCHQGAGDGGKCCGTHGHHMGLRQPLRFELARPGHGGARAAHEGQRSRQHAIGRMSTPQPGEQRTREVLRDEGEHRDGAEDDQRLAAAPQRRELGGKPDRGEEDEQQRITRALAEGDVDVGGELEDEDQHGDDHRAHDGVGHVEAAEQRYRLAHEAPNEEGDEADQHGRELAQLDALHQFHESPPLPGPMLTPGDGRATGALFAPQDVTRACASMSKASECLLASPWRHEPRGSPT